MKFNALVEAIHDLDVHVVRSEPEAFLLEGKLIKEFHPRYNISFRDDKRFLVNPQRPDPQWVIHPAPKDDGAGYFGPCTPGLAPHTRSGAAPVQPARLPRVHARPGGLQALPLRAPNTAPRRATRQQYLEQVLAACDFIACQCHEMKDQLEIEMRKAAHCAGLREGCQPARPHPRPEGNDEEGTVFERVPYNLPLAMDRSRYWL